MGSWTDTIKERRNGEADGFVGNDESNEAAEKRFAGEDIDDEPAEPTAPVVPAEPTPASDPNTPNPVDAGNRPFA